MARPTNDRLIGVLLIGLGVFAVLWVRCFWLQVAGAGRYAAAADAQHYATQRLRAARGTIYDRDQRSLAMTVPVPSVFADPALVEAKPAMARQLAGIVHRDPRQIESRLKKERRFVWIARQMTPGVKLALLPLHREGVGIIEEPKRFYPHGRLAGHLIGFTDVDQRGLEGLELALNGMLQGHDGWRATLRDAKGDLLVGPWTAETAPIDGHDLVLTIDSVVQQVAEDTLEWGMHKYHAKGGSIVAMDPHTGAILALANAPSYDPNAPGGSSAERRRNRAVTDLFEPGSTFKVVTAAALLDLGRITPEEPIFCENGAYPAVGRHVLHDHTPHGTLAFRDVIKYSSNIGTVKAAQRLTPEELYRYIQAFGFGRKTGVEVPGEVSGLAPAPARWSKMSSYNIPMGQGVAATPMQLAVMVSVIANGGSRVRPHVIDRVVAADGRVIRSHASAAAPRVIRPETAATLQQILVEAVASGTGQLATVQGLVTAGKTGTAQKLEPDGRYSHSRFVASFVGFGPVPDPRFVIAICMDEPRPVYFGGVVSAPMFKRMVEHLASYWELPRRAIARSP
ncbi:MAG: penicillin-binding protein 2 [Candidatus Omnitrophica bacterium]|nr:penicillin-binding protein 2 [Candidatus Omnitrophota bacterium]